MGKHGPNLSLTAADLEVFADWQPRMRQRCIKADCGDHGETNERIRVWEPRRHLDGDVRWSICRTADGLWLEDYDNGAPWGPLPTITDAFRPVEEFIEADTAALIDAIPVLEPVAF